MRDLCKYVLIGGLFAVATGCVYASNQQAREYPVQLCEKAKYGRLDVTNTTVTDPHINSYLLSCAVSVVIVNVSFQSGSHEGDRSLKEDKKAIAEHFLMQTLDLTYRSADGDNALMSVITSFLPEPWKENAVRILLDKGVNLKETNHNRDTALDIARFKGNERITTLVSG